MQEVSLTSSYGMMKKSKMMDEKSDSPKSETRDPTS